MSPKDEGAANRYGAGSVAEQRYRALFENMSEGFVIGDAIRDGAGRLIDYWIRDANAVYRRRGPGGHDMIGRRLSEVRPSTAAGWFGRCHSVLESGESARLEFFDALSDRWYDAHLVALSDDQIGQFFVDITDRKRAEQRQADLFAELNHRVKNNLATVAAMLSMQARSGSPAVREQLMKAVDRIHSIADLHALLYRNGDIGDLEVCAYLEEIGTRLREALLKDRPVVLELHCDPIVLPIDDAVSLGVVINELVTNASKHAFPGDRAGRIEVRLTQAGEALALLVRDDGAGGVKAAAQETEGLGMRLVRSMASGLGGELELVDGPGTTVQLVFHRSPEAAASGPTGG